MMPATTLPQLRDKKHAHGPVIAGYPQAHQQTILEFPKITSMASFLDLGPVSLIIAR